MYIKHITVSLCIFTLLLAGAYFLNETTKREYKEELIFPLAQYEKLSTTSDTMIVKKPLSLPPFKPREYVRVGAPTYGISEIEPAALSNID